MDCVREGEFAAGRVPVVSHAMDIPRRLKEMDEGYFVMFNVRLQKFEVWHRDTGDGVLECVLPYEELDERTVRHVREHRMERMEALIREIEEHNRRLEERAQREWLEAGAVRTKEAIMYLKNKSAVDEIPKELMDQ